ncbi:MAG: hypothetical protein EPN82_10485 [Bacteroidetes bacterium]|nr:MAG: hypothetical protein EPN82_10485 [Bacteroidota bacterium]
MRIKKFISRNLKEGKAKILQELGEDAVILSTKTIKKPDGTNEAVEIVAAIDDSPLKATKKPITKNILKSTEIPYASKYALEKGENKFMRATSQIYDELNSIKSMVADISDSVKYIHSSVLTDVFRDVYLCLRKSELTEDFSLKIATALSVRGNINSFDEALTEARILATEHIVIKEPVKKQNSRVVSAFIGPTGSGKTTCLIKLALVSKLLLKANVLVVSADVNKVGGVEQLQTLASVSSIPYQSVNSPSELKNIIEQEQKRDFIFIDTAGNSPLNNAAIENVGSMLKETKPDNIYLVQSVTMSGSSFSKSITEFNTLEPDSLILTKLDEAPLIGEIVMALKDTPIAISYLTTGQKIPEDIEPASRKAISKSLLPDELSDKNYKVN